jgi:putative ABC transport system substrate-binding protein
MLTLRGIALVGVMVLVAPLAADAQQSARPARIGFLAGASPAFAPDSYNEHAAFVAGLREHGYIVGQNVLVEFRSALGGGVDRYEPLAAELVGLKLDVIVTSTEVGVNALRDVSRTIPIVMVGASTDPVATGMVASLARPGGNVTGVTLGDLAGKRMQLLKEMIPGLRAVAAFHGNLAIPFVSQWLRASESAAQRLGLTLHPVQVPLTADNPGRWGPIFESTARRGVGAVTIHEAPRFETQRQLLADLAVKHRLPMVFTFRVQAEAGGLMSYQADVEEINRRAGNLTARILKGAKPADLPVEEPTTYQFVVNMKTAKALGLTIPPTVLARATQVIE